MLKLAKTLCLPVQQLGDDLIFHFWSHSPASQVYVA